MPGFRIIFLLLAYIGSAEFAWSSSNSWLDLGFFDNSKTDKVYFDKESVRVNQGFRQIWIMTSQLPSAKQDSGVRKKGGNANSNLEIELILNSKSNKTQWEIDCEKRLIRKVIQIFYSRELGAGIPLHTEDKPERFKPVTPKSWGGTYLKIACN